MTEIERIIGQMKAAFDGGAWHGPAVMEILRDVDWVVAQSKVIFVSHNIWELVVHLTATSDIIRRRIDGEQAGLDEQDFWPPCAAAAEENWQTALADLDSAESRLQNAVAKFPEGRLDSSLMAGSPNSAYTTFHGHVQHNLYHAGQMALLKKSFPPIPF